MEVIFFPAGWEHQAAPAATLFAALGPSLVWWVGAVALLAGGLALMARRPELALALAVAASFMLGVATDGLVDDAYIQFRYAANLAEGHGPVFNPGERIEGASGGLWLVLLGGLGALSGWDVASLGRFLSLLLVPAGTLVAGLVGRSLAGPRGGAATAILWASLPTVALYAATGLETSAFALALWLVGLAALRERPAVALLAGAGVAMLRPEGLVLGVCALPAWRRLPRAGRAALVAVLVGAALIAALRWSYYGAPVPRSAVVKGVTGAAGMWQGLGYLGGVAFEWWPLLVALPLLRRPRLLAPVLLPVALWTALVTVKGGDWMPGGRYLLPLAVFLVASAGVTLPRRRWGSWALVLALSWGCLQLAPAEEPSRSPVGGLWRAMAKHRVQSRWWESLGTWLGQAVPAGTWLASAPAGALPYASGLPTFDLYGLSSPAGEVREGVAGHRLWGLADAMERQVDLVYPGLNLPQTDDWPSVLAAAHAHVQAAPGLEATHPPVGIQHAAEYRTDVLTDLLWVRAELLPLGPEQSGIAEPVP